MREKCHCDDGRNLVPPSGRILLFIVTPRYRLACKLTRTRGGQHTRGGHHNKRADLGDKLLDGSATVWWSTSSPRAEVGRGCLCDKETSSFCDVREQRRRAGPYPHTGFIFYGFVNALPQFWSCWPLYRLPYLSELTVYL